VAFLLSPAERPDNRIGEEPWAGPPHVSPHSIAFCLLLTSARPELLPSLTLPVCTNQDTLNATRLARQHGTQPPSPILPSKQRPRISSYQIPNQPNRVLTFSALPRHFPALLCRLAKGPTIRAFPTFALIDFRPCPALTDHTLPVMAQTATSLVNRQASSSRVILRQRACCAAKFSYCKPLARVLDVQVQVQLVPLFLAGIELALWMGRA
jgi:hypothetical protein